MPAKCYSMRQNDKTCLQNVIRCAKTTRHACKMLFDAPKRQDMPAKCYSMRQNELAFHSNDNHDRGQVTLPAQLSVREFKSCGIGHAQLANPPGPSRHRPVQVLASQLFEEPKRVSKTNKFLESIK